MTTYTIIDQTSKEQFTFTLDENKEFYDLMDKVEDLMYIHRECNPITPYWKTRLVVGHTVRWSYHGLEFMDMYYHKESGTFTIWDVRA